MSEIIEKEVPETEPEGASVRRTSGRKRKASAENTGTEQPKRTRRKKTETTESPAETKKPKRTVKRKTDNAEEPAPFPSAEEKPKPKRTRRKKADAEVKADDAKPAVQEPTESAAETVPEAEVISEVLEVQEPKIPSEDSVVPEERPVSSVETAEEPEAVLPEEEPETAGVMEEVLPETSEPDAESPESISPDEAPVEPEKAELTEDSPEIIQDEPEKATAVQEGTMAAGLQKTMEDFKGLFKRAGAFFSSKPTAAAEIKTSEASPEQESAEGTTPGEVKDTAAEEAPAVLEPALSETAEAMEEALPDTCAPDTELPESIFAEEAPAEDAATDEQEEHPDLPEMIQDDTVPTEEKPAAEPAEAPAIQEGTMAAGMQKTIEDFKGLFLRAGSFFSSKPSTKDPETAQAETAPEQEAVPEEQPSEETTEAVPEVHEETVPMEESAAVLDNAAAEESPIVQETDVQPDGAVPEEETAEDAAPETEKQETDETPVPEPEEYPQETAEEEPTIVQEAQEEEPGPVEKTETEAEETILPDDILAILNSPHVDDEEETKPLEIIREDPEILAREQQITDRGDAPVVMEEAVPGKMPSSLKLLKNPFLYIETLSRSGEYDKLFLTVSMILKWAVPLAIASYGLSGVINRMPFSYVRMTFSDTAWLWFRAVCTGFGADWLAVWAMTLYLTHRMSRNDFWYQLGGDRMFLGVKLCLYTAAAVIGLFSPYAGAALCAAGMTASVLIRCEITLKQAENRVSSYIAVCIYAFVLVLIAGLLARVGFMDIIRILSAI